MLKPRHLRDLLVDPLQHPRGAAHLSAASGLVRVHRRLYVVADDEHHLGALAITGQAPVELLRLLPGNLPAGIKGRKRAKADLETLLHTPPMPGHPFGALAALGSGSAESVKRNQAVVVPLDASGRTINRLHVADLSPLYQRLRKVLGGLNIEGGFAVEGQVCLLQRGNKGDLPNACVRYDRKDFLGWLMGRRDEHPVIESITEIDLGQVQGVPLSLTDGVALPGGYWAFSAVAEDTDNSYDDGACLASMVGVVDANGSLVQSHRLTGAPKVEGISAVVSGRKISLTMVTDDDNPALPSRLLQVDF